jgi:hypothetical protein
MERRNLVLAHELVHVARHDALRQILSRLASALYWFHPLAHVAARKALLAREQACDEAVIALGNRPSVYARHLLELADPARVPLPVLSLIEQPQLEARVMAILRPGHRSGRVVTAAAAVCASLWALTVAASAPTSRADVIEPSAVSGEGAVAAGSEREPFRSGEPSAAPTWRGPLHRTGRAYGTTEATTHPESPAAFSASSFPGPRLLPQERTCWADAAGESFVGNAFSYAQPDGSRVTERYGWVGDDRVIQTRTEETMVCMRAHGSVTLSEDGERVAALTEGSWIVMGSRDAGRSMDLVITSGPSGPEYAWFVDGARRDFGPEAIEWRNAMVPLLAAYWDVPEAGAARQALASSERAARANLEALTQARREVEPTGARVAGELVARQERRDRELLEAARALDSVNAAGDRMRRRERTLPEGQLETLRRELDSVRAAVERRRAELGAIANATRDAQTRAEAEAMVRVTRDEAVRVELARAQAELSRTEAQRRTVLDRVAREVEEMSRRENTADPAALERGLAEIQQQLEQEIRRLQEAIRRIP